MQQDYLTKVVRASTVLTNAYVAGNILGAQPATPDDIDTAHVYLLNQLILYVSFTIGSLTDARLKIEFSDDGVTYYQETSTSTPTTGVVTDTVIEHKYTATGNYRIALPLKDRWVKISSMGTGTVTNSLFAVKAIIGNV